MKKLTKVILFIVLAALSGIAMLLGLIFWVGRHDYKYTGQELFDEVNFYRETHGRQALTLNPILCDNLVERYLAIKSPDNGHKGFPEWIQSENIRSRGGFGQIGELYVKDVSTPQNAIDRWSGSPGHNSTLLMPSMSQGCAYASDGTGVVIMAEK